MKAFFFNSIKKILHPLAVFAYGWYLKGALSLKKRVGVAHHPLYALVSRRHLHHAVLISMALMALGHTVVLQRVDEQEFLLPVNAIARLFVEEDQFIRETRESFKQINNEYVPTIGLRSRPNVDEDDAGTSVSPPADPGSLAVIPDALIKPIVPLVQQEPARQRTIQTYVVKAGDTLNSIARANGLRIATLLWANNLTEQSLLRIGQRLIILPVDGIHYRVQRGDTLGAIARRYSSDIDKIMKTNNMSNPNAVAIGELLLIPDATIPTVRQRQMSSPGLLARVRNVIAPGGTSARAGGRFIWPTSARRITQYFSWRHPGVDIAGPPSNRIYAAADGVVTFAGWANGYGLSVVVDNGRGRQTRYAHSRKLFVKKGDSVSQGETIAMVGNTGWSTGPHLHFEIMLSGRRVNPFQYIR